MAFLRIGAVAVVLVALTLALASAASGGVRVYPSSQTIPTSGQIKGGSPNGVLNTAIGEREGLWLVVSGATQVSAILDRGDLGAIAVQLLWGHFVTFGARAVPDALLPWNGSARPAEHANQPLYVQVLVPYGTTPGSYSGSVRVTADGATTVVPLSVRVFPLTLPQPGLAAGNFLTSFHLAPEAYLKKVATLNGFTRHEQRIEANAKLYSLLATYRISPGSWGFGKPQSRTGYEASSKWWLDTAGNMKEQLAAGPFSAMRLPISSNRASAGSRIAGVAYNQPETWCEYLEAVRRFWDSNGWLGTTLQYLYAFDEPGQAGYPLVARQSIALRECWPGARLLLTSHPSARNASLHDGEGSDDVDIWTVLSRRFYGRFTAPPVSAGSHTRARENFRLIEAVRKAGKSVWSYTYSGVPGTPGYAATEPLSNPRMFLLWNALEGTDGTLYGQGTTSYRSGDSLDSVTREGEFLLLYPGGVDGPIASARLEQIRDGIEDALIFAAVRRKDGASRVRSILGGTGLFSATAAGVRLACTMGCELKSSTKFAWPLWSHDESTPDRIERARLRALEAAS